MSANILPNIDLSGCPLTAFASIALLLEEEGGREMLEAAVILTNMKHSVSVDPPPAPIPAPVTQPKAQPEPKTRSQKRARESLVTIDSNDAEDIKPPKKKSKTKAEDTQKVTSNSSHKLFAAYVASFPEFPKNVTAEVRKQAFIDDPSVAEIVNDRQLRCAGCHEIRNLDGVYMVNNWTKHHRRCKKLFENWLNAQHSN